jgi:glycosyltransferase involved in cell wall biosynthesis
MSKNFLKKEKFIEIVPIGYTGSLGILKKEDYLAIPANSALKIGYDTQIISTAQLTTGIYIPRSKRITNAKIKIIQANKWSKYIKILYDNRNSIIFSNDRTAKSFIACFFGKYNVFMSHQSRNPPIWWQRQIFKFFVKKFDAIKVSNPFEIDELIKLGVKREKIHYIPLSIDYEFFEKKSDEKLKEKTREKYGIEENEKVFLFLANIRKFKRVKTALNAMKILKDKNIKFKFIVVGSDFLKDEKEKNVIEIAKELGISDKIIMTGWQSPKNTRNIMNISDICINSSIHEGQCLVVYEAATADLPLCVSNIGSFTSVFTKSALFHDPEDFEKLAQNIQYYLKNPNIAKKHSKINKKIVKERCDYEVVEKKLIKLFTVN